MSPVNDSLALLVKNKEVYAILVDRFRAMEKAEHSTAIELAESALFNPLLVGAAQRQKGRHEMVKEFLFTLEQCHKKGA